MAYKSDSLNRRSLGPAIASAVVGIAMGVVAVLGIAAFSDQDAVPHGNAVTAEDAMLGGPEYGTRQ
ncbi:DUF2613 domain-containing protein [Corynebacterium halotolerans]|uniref:DUF2613 domain-containing protein n=1 Tax=Corynebacterium halotolerans TaxID=225326 RepID=UPI003CF57335